MWQSKKLRRLVVEQDAPYSANLYVSEVRKSRHKGMSRIRQLDESSSRHSLYFSNLHLGGLA